MYPSYRWTDSYPYHANPMHYAPIDDRKPKEITSHMKMDPNTSNSPYHNWPYGSNYYYPNPNPIQHEYHNCCNHGYFGSAPYTLQPPYPHYPPPPPPPFHSHGFYPPFPGAYPIPPLNHSADQPKYEYQNDKNTHTSHHCCGCSRRDEEKKLEIEQKESEVEKKTSDSLVPLLLKDCPYPIVWVPPGYKNTESNSNEKEKHSHDPVMLKALEEPSKQGNGVITQDQQVGEGNRFPFPIFWLPYKNNKAENNSNEKNKSIVELLKPEEKKSETKKNDEGESEMNGGQKVIPVKQLGAKAETKIPKRIETKVKADNGIEANSSPKLPPVCLRVDPLPKKKNDSRSPSPPAKKERSKESPVNDSKSSQQQMDLSEGLKKSNGEQTKGNIKTIEVSSEDVKGEACKVEEKKKYSEEEAALMIQSVYRGFEVRKSQPLKKLKQIAEVGKQVVELRNRVKDLESNMCVDEKQKLIIGETIMSLLLKLDTIQGLHPIVRDVRKSVAKEVVSLQEKLDSLTLVKSESTENVMHPEEDMVQEKADETEGQSRVEVKNEELNNDQLHLLKAEDEESGTIKHDEVEGDINLESSVESKTQFHNTEQPVDDEKTQTMDEWESQHTASRFESKSVENVESGIDKELASNETCDIQVPTTTLVDMDKDVNENQPEDSAPKADDVEQLIMEDCGGAPPLSTTGTHVSSGGDKEPTDEENENQLEMLETRKPIKQENSNPLRRDSKRSTEKEVGSVEEDVMNEIQKEDAVETSTKDLNGGAPPLNGGDTKLMEENQKLKVAVEDLLKAGNKQLDVIRELTARVKDLEKKRSHKKKVKVRKGRSRAYDELRSCIV